MLKNVLWLTPANFAMRAVSMLFQVYLSGEMGAAGLGLLQLIMTVHAFAITVGTSGIRVAAMYLSAEEYGHRRLAGVRAAMTRCIGAGLILSTLVGAAMLFGAKALAFHWVKDLRATDSLRLLGLTLPLTCLNSVLCGYFTACGKIKQLVLVEICDKVCTILLTMWLLNMGVKGDLSHACVSIVAGGALASLGSAAVLLWLMWKDLRRYTCDSTSHGMGKRLVRFCIPVALNDYLRSGLGTLEQFLIPYGLARCGGSRARAMADYGTIQGMVFPVLMFMSTVLFSVSDLLIPQLARCRAAGATARLQDISQRCLKAGVLFSLTVGGFIFVTAEPLGLLLYDSEAAGKYLRLFAPLLPILYLDCIVDGMHKGLGQQLYCVRVNTLTNFLDVAGLFLLLPRFGIGGYFFTYAATHVLNFFLSFHKLMKVTDTAPPMSFLIPAVLGVCIAAGIVILQLPSTPQWSNVLLGGGIYLSLLFLIWSLTIKYDEKNISKYQKTA